MSEDTLLIIAIVVLAVLLLGAVGVGFGGALDRYTHIASWFQNVEWKKINLIFALIFSLINFGLIGFLGVIIRRHHALVWRVPEIKTKEAVVLPKDEISQTWKNIKALTHSGSSSDWSIAILQADVLLSDVLHNLGYEGATMADQLKIVDPTRLPSLKNVWAAHRLRNVIAHDPTETHTHETMLHAIDSFERGLKELGMMEEEK